MTTYDKECHVCGSNEVRWVEDFPLLPRVTSDCRLWPSGGELGICSVCRTVVKAADDLFLKECAAIYDTYEVYYQAQGEEQKVFEQLSGLSASRSELILRRLMETIHLEPEGRLIDIGCGNGNLLRSFGRLMPDWLLAGHELNEKCKEEVSGIHNVYTFYSGDLDAIDETFDVITLIHCLEHIVHPKDFLGKIRQRLAVSGYLVIQVPDYTRNPFDLAIADHCTHFDPDSIQSLLGSAGFRVVYVASIIAKELTIAAVRQPTMLEPTPAPGSGPYRKADMAVRWLADVASDAQRIASHERFGIFGTSIAGTWLYNWLRDEVRFFVDEDMHRIGGLFFGKEIIAPTGLCPADHVYLPFPYPYVTQLHERIRVYPAIYCLPPTAVGKLLD